MHFRKMINFMFKKRISTLSAKKVLIMSRKTPITGKERHAKRYYNKLFTAINKSPGLINIESFGLNTDKTQEFVTFTEWENLDNWQKWKDSEKRSKISVFFQDSLITDEHYILQDLKYNFPLL